jgi:hypothetical protein
MDFDDIVVGSGLSALGAVLGMEARRRVLVIANPVHGDFSYYDERRTVPCAYSGAGGLGNAWHGVIPTGWRNNFGNADAAGFAALLKYFYPHINVGERIEQPWLFVPWRAIRPPREFQHLVRQRGERLTLLNETALSVSMQGNSAEVMTATSKYRARRVWLAAGALRTPVVLKQSFGRRLNRGLVSDHAFCYIGQTASEAAPRLTHSREGMFFPARYSAEGDALYTLRPARFAFRRLDYGIEQRALFGLPTGNAVAKIARRASPGLLAEAFYNRFGLFPSAGLYSVYAQVAAPDAYAYDTEGQRPVQARLHALRAATDAARAHPPYKDLVVSRRPEAFIPGIHLHHSLDLAALAQAGINSADSSLQIVDASVLDNIGPDHHSFKMMLSAYDRVKSIHAADDISTHLPIHK